MSTEPIQVVSDFVEPYDAYFDHTGITFRRIAHEGPSKEDQFEILDMLGYDIPQYGKPAELPDDSQQVVVYTDEYQHAGKGKILVSLEEARSKYADYLASCFIECQQNIITSYKLLQIGTRQFIVRYNSDHEWMSNKGQVYCDIVAESPHREYIKQIQYPLWSIDYVLDLHQEGKPVAIDFNIAPQMHEFDIEAYIDMPSITKEIREAIYYFKTLKNAQI